MLPELVGVELDPDDPELEAGEEPELGVEPDDPAADEVVAGVSAEEAKEAPGTIVTTDSAAAAAVGAISAEPTKKSH